MTNQYSFETYWTEQETRLRNAGFREWLITTMRQVAKTSWNVSRSSVHDELLETNVIINKGIWKAITEQKSENNNDNV